MSSGFSTKSSEVNLFLHPGDFLLTLRTVSALAGITCATVMDFAKTKGLRVLEADLNSAWLDRAAKRPS